MFSMENTLSMIISNVSLMLANVLLYAAQDP